MTHFTSNGRPAEYIYNLRGGVFTSLGQASKALGVHKSTIVRWCNNPNIKDCYRELVYESKQKPCDTDDGVKVNKFTPLEYLMKIINDESADEKLRLQAANWAAPYLHPKASVTKGKKEEREERAKQAGSGRFSASHPPKLKALK